MLLLALTFPVVFATVTRPFSVISFTPSVDSASVGASTDSVSITGLQSLIVTFDSPVIALGSDFGAEQLPDALNPFEIQPVVSGKVRWVTTTIARLSLPSHVN